MRLAELRALRVIAAVYTELFKNIPLLAIIFVTYFGLTSVAVRLDVFEAGCLSLILFYAAYLSEIFRAAISGVHARPARGGRGARAGPKCARSCSSSRRRRCGSPCLAPPPWRSTCSSPPRCW